MRALWLEDGVLRAREDADPPRLGEGEALVRVRLAGICGTDLELLRGYYPFAGIPGHEFVGVVEEAPGALEWVGRRVVGEINAACGGCPTCRAGRTRHCPSRTVLGIRGRHGAFAERLALPVSNLHAVPDAVSDEDAVFTEPLAAALEVQEQVSIAPGMHVVVVGAGRLGQLVARTLALTGCDLTVVTRRAEADALLAGAGIPSVPADALGSATADVVVECTGNPEGLDLARRLVRPRGTIVLKSTYAGEARVNLSSVVVDEVSLVGSRCGPFPWALETLARGAVDLLPLRHGRRPLTEGVAAFAEAGRPGTLKILLEC